MKKKILITGGAGFIGSHLLDALVEGGHSVRIIDSLEPQVHGLSRQKPDYLSPEAEFIKSDIRNSDVLKKAIKDIEVIFHFASAVGIGQSMYEINRYTNCNISGTANLLETIISRKNKIKKIIVASSMSIYGEGKYRCLSCGVIYPKTRFFKQIKNKYCELRCSRCQKTLRPVATDEEKPSFPQSIYAITKSTQEQMCLSIGRAYKIPTVALRFFNVYGTRQALSNPYTGVLAIFSCRVLNNKPPVIFEDGLQTRDFIHIKDIVQANILAMEKKEADFQIYNVGTGKGTSIVKIAEVLIKKLNLPLKIKVTNRFREGDIRHCFADIAKIKKELGFSPQIIIEEGIDDLISWLKNQSAIDKISQMEQELKARGLIR